MIKPILIISFFLMKAFEAVICYLDESNVKAGLPENVKDVYDEEEYNKFRSYKKDNSKVNMLESVIETVILAAFLIFNVYAFVFNKLSSLNIYLQYFIVILLFTLISLPISTPFSYYRTFVIEEKYGMNKATKKTFFSDEIKSFIISVIFTYILMSIIMFLFETFGNAAVIWTFAVFTGISILLSCIIVPVMRIFNKFTPLEDGELRDKLLALCGKYGVTVKKIVIKDASRRTTKSNAFCTGIGKRKTISLDDNLVNNFSSDEIVSVFAHEFAHAKYKHVLKSMPFSLFRTGLTILAFGAVLNILLIFTAFGFEGINYFFAENILTCIVWPVSTVLDIISNYFSRKHEYEADAFAAKEGYGQAIIDSLKKLSKESLSNINPHPAVVMLEYSHPTLSQRVAAIEKII